MVLLFCFFRGKCEKKIVILLLLFSLVLEVYLHFFFVNMLVITLQFYFWWKLSGSVIDTRTQLHMDKFSLVKKWSIKLLEQRGADHDSLAPSGKRPCMTVSDDTDRFTGNLNSSSAQQEAPYLSKVNNIKK